MLGAIYSRCLRCINEQSNIVAFRGAYHVVRNNVYNSYRELKWMLHENKGGGQSGEGVEGGKRASLNRAVS